MERAAKTIKHAENAKTPRINQRITIDLSSIVTDNYEDTSSFHNIGSYALPGRMGEYDTY